MSSNNLQSLFDNAQDEGLSMQTVGILVNNLNGSTIAGAQGASVDDLAGDEATLFVRVIDRTGSMGYLLMPVDDQYGGKKRVTEQEVVDVAKILGRNLTVADVERDDRKTGGQLRLELSAEMVRFCANEQLGALIKSKQGDSILMSTWTFNDRSTLLHSYLSLGQAMRLDQNNYDPNGMTALYDATLDAITSAVAYAQSLIDAGIRVKVVIVVITDGDDNASRNSAAKVRSIIEDLLRQEIYTVALVALGTDGDQIAAQLGIPSGNVLTEKSDPSSIRHALGTVSASVIRASQTVIGQQNSQSFFS